MALRLSTWLLLLSLGAYASGCAPHFAVTTPKGFVELQEAEESDYAYRATTADGLVLAVRELEHEPQGDLAFWVAATENALRQRGGYALLGTKEAKAGSLKGKTLEFGHDERGEPHRYFITIYVTPKRLFVLEAGGKQTLTDARSGDIEAFFKDFQAR